MSSIKGIVEQVEGGCYGEDDDDGLVKVRGPHKVIMVVFPPNGEDFFDGPTLGITDVTPPFLAGLRSS